MPKNFKYRDNGLGNAGPRIAEVKHTATKKQFDACLNKICATLDEGVDNNCLNVDAPVGKIFKANGCHCLVEQYSNVGGQSWIGEAYHELIERMSLGLDDCPDNDCDVCNPEE